MSQPTVNRWLRGFREILKRREHRGKDTVKFIGEDHLGNKYYEAYRPGHSRPNQRYFNRSNGLVDVADAANVPPLWDSWLRHRRNDPPTKEEVQNSEDYFTMQQAMAAEKKAQELGETKQNVTDKEPSFSGKGPLKRPDITPIKKTG